MKKFTKTLIASALLTASAASFAGVSANVGAMSDYWYRGLDQSGDGGNASMMGGLDYESEMGFYAGTWLASLPSDLEYDLYAGYNGSIEDFSYGVGIIGYYYDESATGEYFEYNLSAGYGPISVGYNIGTYESPGAADVDYTFASITGEYEGAYLTYGVYGDEVDGSYFEAGYGMTYEGLDMSVAAIFPDDDSSATNNWVSDSDQLTFTISKSFDLF
ncbi:TorF family putative porin [Amphritea sp. 2_MG-2023]|uniref:TorF family putative porin n=1 Tax=Amphritea TaxID=515417 RepID=UPI001C07DA34|nr:MULTISPECIES: TorF family putative porin [Amphritea]MBU2966142.1 TorF family putative porin [Amphritea atlantica]MDO6418203.1 TorF family putative porin [Amphritea sp. 2_MG-2023]MDX2422725.1 TorF family putative porin [Amphritea sp.]